MTLQVMDRGPGFPTKEISLILTSFTEWKVQKPEEQDWGFQLPKGFTEAHKGTISVENRQNGGAKFYGIKIPTEIPQAEINWINY